MPSEIEGISTALSSLLRQRGARNAGEAAEIVRFLKGRVASGRSGTEMVELELACLDEVLARLADHGAPAPGGVTENWMARFQPGVVPPKDGEGDRDGTAEQTVL